MGLKDTVNALIDANIYANGEEKITGQGLNATLKSVVEMLPTTDEILTGINGTATESNAPNTASGFFRYVVTEPITTGSAWGIEVTQAELDDNWVFFNVTDGVITKDTKPQQGGKSAYQLAVEAGYVGTEIEWLESLNGADGNDGADGKTTEQWTAKPFVAGSTVYFGGNSIWEAAEDTLDTDVPGVSPKWVLRLTANETTDGTKLLNICDAQGNVLGSYDKDGNFETQFKDMSIENDALQREIAAFFEGSEITETSDFQSVVADPAGHIISGVKKDGTHYFNTIEADHFKGNIKQTTTEEHPITDATFLTFDFPDSVVEVDIFGDLPVDVSDARTPTDVILTFSKSGHFLFKCKAVMAIQGHGSAVYIKKGYEFDFLNANDEPILIKWGRMHAVDAINFKAFATDPTHTRDVSAGRFWHNVRTSRPFPSSFIADFTSNTTTGNDKYQYYDDALFYADGFPLRITHNGNPFGLYTWRMKKKRENYRMDSKNNNNIFLDLSINTGMSLLAFDPAWWDLKSPKLSGYEEGGPISNATVLNSINRFFNWMGACVAGSTDMRTTYADYLNLDSWIDYIIVCEVIYNWDASTNNTELMTWDGQRWSLCIYDADNSAGLQVGIQPVHTGVALSSPWFLKVKEVFDDEIKARYTELRNNGVLSMNNIQRIYGEIPRTIPTEYYLENLAIWGWVGSPSTWTSFRHILDFLNKRIIHLDTIYKN